MKKISIYIIAMLGLLVVIGSCKKDRWSPVAGFYNVKKATVGNTVYTDTLGTFRLYYNSNQEDYLFNDFVSDIRFPSSVIADTGVWGYNSKKELMLKFDSVEYFVDIKKQDANNRTWTIKTTTGEVKEVLELERL